MSIRNRLIAVVLAVAVWTPTDGRALELGVTPSDVFGLWTNINTTILDYARLRSKTPEWDQRLAAMAPKKFTGKRPGDVLVEVEEVSRLVAVFGNHGDPHARTDFFAEEIAYVLRDETAAAKPSLVFLHSTHVLVDMVDVIMEMERAPRRRLIGPYFKAHAFEGKTPSDVFGVVDLARRRMEEIVRHHRQNALLPIEAAQ